MTQLRQLSTMIQLRQLLAGARLLRNAVSGPQPSVVTRDPPTTSEPEVDVHSYAIEVAGPLLDDAQAVWMLWSPERKRFLTIHGDRLDINGKSAGLQFCSRADAAAFMPAFAIVHSLIPVQVVSGGYHISADVSTSIRSLNIDAINVLDYPVLLTAMDDGTATWTKQSVAKPLMFSHKQTANDVRSFLRNFRHVVVGVPGLVELNQLTTMSVGVQSAGCYFRTPPAPCKTDGPHTRSIRIR